jgi:hypothetical protein
MNERPWGEYLISAPPPILNYSELVIAALTGNQQARDELGWKEGDE